jgi:hypothetical protein
LGIIQDLKPVALVRYWGSNNRKSMRRRTLCSMYQSHRFQVLDYAQVFPRSVPTTYTTINPWSKIKECKVFDFGSWIDGGVCCWNWSWEYLGIIQDLKPVGSVDEVYLPTLNQHILKCTSDFTYYITFSVSLIFKVGKYTSSTDQCMS